MKLIKHYEGKSTIEIIRVIILVRYIRYKWETKVKLSLYQSMRGVIRYFRRKNDRRTIRDSRYVILETSLTE